MENRDMGIERMLIMGLIVGLERVIRVHQGLELSKSRVDALIDLTTALNVLKKRLNATTTMVYGDYIEKYKAPMSIKLLEAVVIE